MTGDTVRALGRIVWKLTLVLVVTVVVMWAIGWMIGATTGNSDDDTATVIEEP